MIRIIFICLVMLGGCQISQKSEDNLSTEHAYSRENPWLRQAEQDVDLAVEQGVEWQVRHVILDNQEVNFRELLKIAQELQYSGKSDAATQLSIEISQLVVLALHQEHDNRNALPLYPQSN